MFLGRRWWMTLLTVPLLACQATPQDRTEPPMTVSPATVSGGGDIEVTFAAPTPRGPEYSLAASRDGSWETTHTMLAQLAGTDLIPRSWPTDSKERHLIQDVGVEDEGPDVLTLPPDLEPGDYRVCVVTRSDDLGPCANLTVA